MQSFCRHLPAVLLGVCIAVIGTTALPARTIVEAGNATVWKYRDDGGDPGAEWRQAEYDDSHWKSGSAPLGFGESGIGTVVYAGPDDRHRPVAAWFRRKFNAELNPGESLVLLLCVDDGAVVYLNGDEIARVNMPAGPVTAATFARQTVGDDQEGFYRRLQVPAEKLHTGRENLLAVEVHQATAASSDLFFDLALKVLPAAGVEARISPEAREVVIAYRTRHFIGPRVKVSDGYIDGGRGMEVDASGGAASGREILMVDRERDRELAADLAFARSASLRAAPPRARVRLIATWIDERMTPPGGSRWVVETAGQLENEFKSKPVLIGDWVDQCQAGVCRHRALMFKILADEAGLRAALVRGNIASQVPPGFAHAWNEVELDGGERVLVDIMQNGGSSIFPAVTDAEVVKRYLKVDGKPWYGPAAEN